MKHEKTTQAISPEFDANKVSDDVLSAIRPAPPVMEHKKIPHSILERLLIAADNDQCIRMRSWAYTSLSAAGWVFDEYRGHPSASHIVFNGAHNYMLDLTSKAAKAS